MTPETEKAIIDCWHRIASGAAILTITLVQALEETRVSVETIQAAATEDGNGKTGLLTCQEVAEELGISESMAYTLTKRGEIPAIRLGRSVRVRPEDLQAYIERQVSLILGPSPR